MNVRTVTAGWAICNHLFSLTRVSQCRPESEQRRHGHGLSCLQGESPSLPHPCRNRTRYLLTPHSLLFNMQLVFSFIRLLIWRGGESQFTTQQTCDQWSDHWHYVSKCICWVNSEGRKLGYCSSHIQQEDILSKSVERKGGWHSPWDPAQTLSPVPQASCVRFTTAAGLL